MLDRGLHSETNDDVLDRLWLYPASLKQLNRARHEGSLPRPIRHGAGRGVWTENLSGTAEQAYELFGLLEANRSFEGARWILYCEGHAVDERKIVSFLRARLLEMALLRDE